MKKHRISLNLFCDYHFNNFLNCADVFVNEVGNENVQNLNLFLSELNDENVTETLYKVFYDFLLEQNDRSKVSQKTEKVCKRLRDIMHQLSLLKFLNPILMTYIKTSRIADALKKIRSIEEETKRNDALKFVSYMIDSNTLFNEALGEL